MAIAAIQREETYNIPSADVFGDDDFAVAPDLEDLAGGLIDRHPEQFGHLAALELAFLWKAKGGVSKGKATLGKCQKPSGLLAFFAGKDWIVWLAADTARDARMTDRQIEAALYHELLHAGFDAERGDRAWVGHDVEMFRSEVEEYGLWHDSLRQVGPAFRQLGFEEMR